MNDLNDILNNLYNKKYTQKYAGSIFITFLALLFFIFLIFYFYTLSTIDNIRENWETERCKPMNMMFAGIIKPELGKTKSQTTEDNFNYCTNQSHKSMFDYLTSPLTGAISSITTVFTQFSSSMNSVRKNMVHIRERTARFFKSIVDKAASVMIAFQYIIIKLKDGLAQIVAVMTTALYGIISLYMSLKALVGAMFQMLVVALVALIALSYFFYASFFLFPLGIICLIFAALLGVSLIMMKVYLPSTFQLILPGVPGIPSMRAPFWCFSKDTKLTLHNGSIININKIKPNDVLHDGTRITSTFKILKQDIIMYRIGNNAIVTPTHKILYKNNIIYAMNHPHAVSITLDETYLYCINTDQKQFSIDDYIFLDWDEMIPDEYMLLSDEYSRITDNSVNITNRNLHMYLESALHKNTKVLMNSNEERNIIDVKPGDYLKGDILVHAVVKVSTKEIEHLKTIYIKNSVIVGSGVWIYNLGGFTHYLNSIYYTEPYEAEENECFYQLVTNKGIIPLENGNIICDYNHGIDLFLHK